MSWNIFWYQIFGAKVLPHHGNLIQPSWMKWTESGSIYLKKDLMICDPQQDFDSQGESTLTTRFHFKTKEFIWTRCSTFETIKSEEVERKSVWKFLNNSLRAK